MRRFYVFCIFAVIKAHYLEKVIQLLLSMAQIKDIFIPKDFAGSSLLPKRAISSIGYVNEGDLLLEYSWHSNTITAPCSGVFVPNYFDFILYSPGSLFGIVTETEEEAFSALYYTDPCIEQDPYTNTKKLVWKGMPKITFSPFSFYGGSIIRLSDQLFFSFEFVEDQGVIVFKANDKLKLTRGDQLSILFENGKILDFQVQKKPVNNGFDTIICTLYQDDIDLFLQSKMVSYRLTFYKEGKSPVTEECGSFYGQYLLKATVSYVNYFLDTLNRLLPDYHLPRKYVAKTPIAYKFNWCYVYLMRDNTNGYHKIGISNKPEYREKTLQSEKPSIEMLACKKFPTRKIAEAIESALHAAYSLQRVRGEWFNLNDEDVAAIIETLK